MIVFVNGKIGFGSPPAGRVFWNAKDGTDNGFVLGACHFLKDQKTFFTKLDFPWYSRVNQRYQQGFYYAKQNLPEWQKQASENEYYHLVSHSMGTAFGEGILKHLHGQGYRVGHVIHINAFQASKIKVPTDPRTTTIDYQLVDDPLINNFFLRILGIAAPGSIHDADHQIYEHSGIGNIFKIHRSPIWKQGKGFWKNLGHKSW